MSRKEEKAIPDLPAEEFDCMMRHALGARPSKDEDKPTPKKNSKKKPSAKK